MDTVFGSWKKTHQKSNRSGGSKYNPIVSFIGPVRERERFLFYASTAQAWAYGGCLKGGMSLRLPGVYLLACHGLPIYGTKGH